MADYRTQIYDLGQIWDTVGKKNIVDNLPENQQKKAFQDFALGYKYYEEYFDVYNKDQSTPITRDRRIVDPQSFRELISQTEVQTILDFFRELAFKSEQSKEQKKDKEVKEEKKDEETNTEGEDEEKPKEIVKVPVPTKEESSVPTELIKGMVDSYRESQADKIEADETHSVADAVKRARNTWDKRNRIQTILKNRTDAQTESDERFFVNTIDPKKASRYQIEANIRLYANQAIIAQAGDAKITNTQVKQAIEDLVYLGLAGTVDLTNYRELSIAAQLALGNQGIDISEDLHSIDTKVSEQIREIETNPYSDKPDSLAKEINLADEKVQQNLEEGVNHFKETLIKNNPDFDLLQKVAAKDLINIPAKLNAAIPYTFSSTQATPLSVHAAEFESLIRKTSPNTLRINPEVIGAQAAGMLLGSGSQTRNISPEAVKLYSLGLNSQNLESLKSNPSIQEFLNKHQDLQKQIEFQLKKIAESKLGQEIQGSIKPISGAVATFNNLSPAAQNAAKLILDPVGTVRSWASTQAGKRIGGFLVEHSGSLVVQKFGNFLMSQGLSGGVKAFTQEAVKKGIIKVGTWAATKLGWSALTEPLNAAIPGLGLLLDIAGQILIWLGEKTIGAVQSLAKSVYGEEIKFRDIAIPVGAATGVALGAGVGLIAGFNAIRIATQTAAVSAVGIIIGALSVTAAYLTIAFLVAPILSTLVQLDSQEKVEYPVLPVISSSDCGWPTKGHYQVQEGPEGGTHARSKLQAIDIYGPGNINATDTVASANGEVVTTGSYSNYGNSVVIKVSNSAGSFTDVYGHMGSISVSPGNNVQQGQKIGTVGSTDLFTNPHIHFEHVGIKYNECPAGGKQIPIGCVGFPACGSVYAN